MGGDGFAFAIGIRRKVDVVGRKRQLLQLGQDLFFPGDDDIFGFEIVIKSTPRLLLGRSFTWPKEASTVNPLPRYFWIVFALAGDSTMTRPLDNGSSIWR